MQNRKAILVILITLAACAGISLGIRHHAQMAIQAQKQAKWEAHYQETVRLAQPAINAADISYNRVTRKADQLRQEIKLGHISRQEAARQLQVEGDVAHRELSRVQSTNYQSVYNPNSR